MPSCALLLIKRISVANMIFLATLAQSAFGNSTYLCFLATVVSGYRIRNKKWMLIRKENPQRPQVIFTVNVQSIKSYIIGLSSFVEFNFKFKIIISAVHFFKFFHDNVIEYETCE